MRLMGTVTVLLLCSVLMSAQDKARVFITDSSSWEISGGGGGANGAFGGAAHGGARPQTAEIIKTFGERCPDVLVNNKQDKADYVVVLDHEGGKGLLRHKNKVAVFNRVSGDSIVSKSTLSLGGSVQDACEAIKKDWAANASSIKAAAEAEAAAKSKAVIPSPTPAVAPEMAKSESKARLNVASTPDGADIEVDGNFVGNTPSSVELAAGDHAISVKKVGYKDWERKMKVTGGEIKVNAELEKKPESAKSQ